MRDSQPDLVMIDAPPGCVGATLNFVQRLRLYPATRDLPILVSTTSKRHVEPSLLRSNGIHVLIKPFAFEDLVTSIDSLLATRPEASE